MRSGIFIFFLSSAFNYAAAQFPETDIFIGDYYFKNGQFEISKLYNFTNREGYDNQPFFHPEKAQLFYSSIRNDGQSDVYRFEWENQRSFRVTETEEAEYSPQYVARNGEISVVKVEKDSSQRLWTFSVRNPSQSDCLIPEIDNLGYYLWLNEKQLSVFLVDKYNLNHELGIYDLVEKSYSKIDTAVGRSFMKIPNENKILYVSKTDIGNWKLKTYDYTNGYMNELTDALESEEDYCILDNHYILAGKGSKIYGHTLDAKNRDWVMIQDLSNKIDGNIQRIALNPNYNKIALMVLKSSE